jgi:hypothetical protein
LQLRIFVNDQVQLYNSYTEKLFMKLKLTLAAVTAATASLAFSSAAEAIQIGSSYTIGGEGRFSSTSIEFIGQSLVTSATGDFDSMEPVGTGNFAIAAVPETFDLSVPGTGLLVNFEDDDFLGFGIIETQDIFDFTVTSVTFLPDVLRYQFRGSFGDGTPGIGELAQLIEVPEQEDIFGYSATFTAVPTPALLPGLIGMGVAALRRKKEDAAEENA